MASSCTPTTTGFASTSGVSVTSNFMGWYDILDFASGYPTGATADTTVWVQTAINTAIRDQRPLYFTPRPFYISGSIVASGPIALLGVASNLDSFTQDGSGNVLTCGSASFVTADGGLEMLCITSDDVSIENINFIVLPGSGTGGRAIHALNCNNTSISNVSIIGARDGILLDSASNVVIEDVLIVPAAASGTSVQRYGIKADGLNAFTSGASAGPCLVVNAVVDQTVYPFSPPTATVPHIVAAFVVDNGYEAMACRSCDARGALYGFRAQNSSSISGQGSTFEVTFSRSYDCTTAVAVIAGATALIQDCMFDTDSTVGIAPSGSPNRGVYIESTFGGTAALSNNVVFGNHSSMVGIDLEGTGEIALNGGAVLNCGSPSTTGGRGDGVYLSTAVSGAVYTVNGLVVRGCSVAGVRVDSQHVGSTTLTAVSAIGNHSSTTTPAYGLLIGQPARNVVPGLLIVDGCNFSGNDVAVSDGSAAITGTVAPSRKIANSIGYNPAISGSWTLLNPGPSTVFNNTGVDQYAYISGYPGKVALQVAGMSVTGIGTVPGVFGVPNTVGISVSTTGLILEHWKWLGN